MKAFKKFTMPLLTIAIAATTVHAQQQPSEDAVNPQNRNPVSSQQGDQAHDGRQTGTVQREQGAAGQHGSVLSAPGAGMAFEQLARTRAEQLEGKSVIAESGKELGEIDRIVTKSSDSALYAVIDSAEGSQSAIRLSQLEVQTLAYDASADDLQQQPYEQSEFEALGMAGHASTGQRQLGQEGAANSNSQSASRGGAAASGSAVAGNATPGDADQPLLTALALTNPAHLEGKLLTGEDGEDIGSIEQIVRSKADNDYYAVVSDSQTRNKAVVKLDELEVAQMSYMGSESDMEQNFRENDYEDVARN